MNRLAIIVICIVLAYLALFFALAAQDHRLAETLITGEYPPSQGYGR